MRRSRRWQRWPMRRTTELVQQTLDFALQSQARHACAAMHCSPCACMKLC